MKLASLLQPWAIIFQWELSKCRVFSYSCVKCCSLLPVIKLPGGRRGICIAEYLYIETKSPRSIINLSHTGFQTAWLTGRGSFPPLPMDRKVLLPKAQNNIYLPSNPENNEDNYLTFFLSFLASWLLCYITLLESSQHLLSFPFVPAT